MLQACCNTGVFHCCDFVFNILYLVFFARYFECSILCAVLCVCRIQCAVFYMYYSVCSILCAVFFVHYSVCSFQGSAFCVHYFVCTQARNNNKGFSPVFCSLSKEGVCDKLQQKTATMFCIVEQMQKHFAFSHHQQLRE